jgi:hypothetical protein
MAMQGDTAMGDPRTQRVVLRLLKAVDRAIEANGEVAEARAALDRLTASPLRVIPAGGPDPTEDS